MSPWKIMASVALVISLVNLYWLYDLRREDGPPMNNEVAGFLSPEDYLEIQQLYAYYARDVDSGSQRDASWMYTEDGVWEPEGMRWEGREALREHYTTFPPGVSRKGIRHFSTNLILVPTEEGVRGSVYMLGVERREEGGPLEINIMGKYEDLLVQTDQGWRFKQRVFRSDTYHDDDTSVLPSPFIPVED